MAVNLLQPGGNTDITCDGISLQYSSSVLTLKYSKNCFRCIRNGTSWLLLKWRNVSWCLHTRLYYSCVHDKMCQFFRQQVSLTLRAKPLFEKLNLIEWAACFPWYLAVLSAKFDKFFLASQKLANCCSLRKRMNGRSSTLFFVVVVFSFLRQNLERFFLSKSLEQKLVCQILYMESYQGRLNCVKKAVCQVPRKNVQEVCQSFNKRNLK